jgi:hypothetical protein
MSVVRRKHIREVVGQLLSEHRIHSGPVNVEAIARGMGLVIRYVPAPEDHSGFLIRDSATDRTIIGVNQNHSYNRKRFTIAHEIGHFLLHKFDKIHVDRTNIGFLIKNRDGRSAEGEDSEEREANLFAAELLMPRQFIERDLAKRQIHSLQDEEEIETLAKRYEVSTQALSFRLANLGYIEL